MPTTTGTFSIFSSRFSSRFSPRFVLVFVLGCLPLTLCLGACYDDTAWEELKLSASASGSSTGEDSDDSGEVTGSSASSEATTDDTTGIDTEGTGGTGGTGGGGGGELLPPAVDELLITPNPINFNGELLVTAIAGQSDGVRLEFGAQLLQGESVLELEETEPGVFEGHIGVFTGLDNGNHVATAIPWRGELEGDEDSTYREGDPVDAVYWINLLDPGEEGYFETGKNLGTGPGQVASIAVLPDGSPVGFGMAGDGESHCYLRQRSKAGVWGLKIDLLPDFECKAIDLKIGKDGTISLLLARKIGGKWLWLLAQMSTWGAPLKELRVGEPDEVAYALAEWQGTLAVCGSAPTDDNMDLTDLMVEIYRPNLGGQSGTFDYVSEINQDAHVYDEVDRGCVFSDKSNLILVGEALGDHDNWKFKRNRRFDFAATCPRTTGTFELPRAVL